MVYSRSLVLFQCVVLGIFALACIFFGMQWYKQNYRIHMIEDALETVRQEKIELEKHIDIAQATSQTQLLPLASTELWRPIQDRIKNTVVQVFVQVSELDMLQPFKTPTQYTGYGSGFIIDQEGHIITNAHVVNQAIGVWVQIPELGRRIIDVEIVGITPDRDLALLKVTPAALEVIKQELGSVPYLKLGNSDEVRRAEETMAVGYPLGQHQHSVKSTNGMVSGFEHGLIQTSSPINPGSSGGPLLNARGEVIGINSSGIVEAQNTGYAIPVNDLKLVLSDLKKIKLLRKPFLGVIYANSSDDITEFLGNPKPGGCYVHEVIPNSPLGKAGLASGDMIYEMNGHKVDLFGDMHVPWSEDKVSIMDYVSHLSVGQELRVKAYRNGKPLEIKTTFDLTQLPAIRRVYPGYEPIDYEVFAGMVVMPLTINHIQMMGNNVPGLARFAEMKQQGESQLIVTHIFPSSELYRSRGLNMGATLNEVNGKKVKTLEDFRAAIKSLPGNKFLTIRASDNVMRVSDNMLVAIPVEKILQQEPILARDYRYPMSETTRDLVMAYQSYKQEQKQQVA